MNQIDWHEDFDDSDNLIWEGASPYQDDGVFFYWRIRQRLRDNRIEWYADHDAELGESNGETWETTGDAKAAIQVEHDEILRESQRANLSD